MGMGCGVADMWFTSDTHLGHLNIIKYAERPFDSVLEMDETIIKLWNERVRGQDHIYHLGDVTMERGGRVQQDAFIKLIRRLNGHKRLILGNHDHFPIQTYLDAGFEKVMAMQRIDGLWLMHVPCHPSNVGSASAVVHGHIHQNPSPPPAVREWEDNGTPCRRVIPYINISLEVTNYHPVSLEWLREEALRLKEEYTG